MTHDPLCVLASHPRNIPSINCENCTSVRYCTCECDLIAKVRADERSRKGTCWREVEGAQIPAGAIRVYREAGWFWEMP